MDNVNPVVPDGFSEGQEVLEHASGPPDLDKFGAGRLEGIGEVILFPVQAAQVERRLAPLPADVID